MNAGGANNTASRKRRRGEMASPSNMRHTSLSKLCAFLITTTTCAAFCSHNSQLGCAAFVQHPPAAKFNSPMASRLFAKETETAEEDDVATYYSPNAALDPTKFRYDLEEENDGKDQSQVAAGSEGDESASANSNPEFNEYSFFDEATIFVRAGSGGQGASTHKKGVGGQNGQPDGGNGGRGGDVILEVDDSLNTLAGLTDAWRPNAFGGGGAAKTGGGGSAQSFRPKSFRAENGQDGIRQFKTGRNGKDAVVRVPPGTVVQEEIDIIDEMKLDKTGKRVVLRTEKRDLGTVTVDEPALLVAEGGEGGEGSATTGKKAGRGVRRPRSSPVGGERRRLKLTLKIVADVALVGVPNAGKSTFLASVTRAKPKIANYPFTTVVPNLGVWVPPNSDGYISDASEGGSGSAGLVLCDVPGLIAGAAEGVGLGHAFLRHVERCHVILHLVDATSADPIGDFDMLNREILRYGNGKLARMPQIVVVNKVDAWEEGRREEWEQGLRVRMSKEELEEKLRAAMTHSRLMWMSAKEGEGVDDLMGRMAMFVRKVKEAGEEN
jgi:GTP-binding protein